MPPTPRRPAPLRGRIFRGSQAIASGLLTRNELRSTAWRPLFRDVYADAGLTVSHRTRCTAAARLLLPPGAALAGRAAAALFGAGTVETTDPLDVVVPAGTRFGPVAGLRVHNVRLDPGDTLDRAGIPVTSPLRTCWDLACWLDAVEAVTVIDPMIAGRLVTASGLRDYALDRAGRRGWRRTVRAANLADGGAESPPESRLRVRLVLAGLPRPRTQYVITRDGRFVARVDLAWPEFRIAIEYDGMWHHDPAQFHRDRRRLNQILGEDWLVLHVTARRLREDFEGFLREVRDALRTRRAKRP
jgi:very-short-patch-repair endonuclease